MITFNRINTFVPRESSLNWFKETSIRTTLEWCSANQNHSTRFALSYAAGMLALVNIATLPLTAALDTIIGLWHNTYALFSGIEAKEESSSLSNRAVHPILHLKIAGKCAFWITATSAYFLGCYIVAAMSCMLCTLHIPRIGRYLGAASVIYILHFPIGWGATMIAQTFIE